MKYLMGIDNGGTVSKAAIFDIKGKQISVSHRKTPLLTPREGFTERDMIVLWEANCEVIRESIAKADINPKDILAVAVTGHGKGLYLVDEKGNPAYNGIVSTDNRANKYVEKWKEQGIDKLVYEKTIQNIIACQPVALLAWLKDNKPEIVNKTRWIFSVKDYIRFKLTGNANAEYTDISGTNLLNLKTKAYDKDLLKFFNLEEIYDKLPPIKTSYELCGTISKEVAGLTGLAVGTAVACGMFDIDACAIGMGVIHEEELCMIAGTWSINEYISKMPVLNHISSNSIFCMPEYYLIEQSSPTSAGNAEWIFNTFLSKEEKDYDKINEMVSIIKPDESDLIFLPFLFASNENPLAKSCIIGLSCHHTKAHIFRAVYEGIVFCHKRHLEKLLLSRNMPKAIRLSGGASNSKIWLQIFADILNLPIEVIGDKEIGALGASMSAGISAGVYTDYEDAVKKAVKIEKTVYPDKNNIQSYSKKYKKYCQIINILNGYWE